MFLGGVVAQAAEKDHLVQRLVAQGFVGVLDVQILFPVLVQDVGYPVDGSLISAVGQLGNAQFISVDAASVLESAHDVVCFAVLGKEAYRGENEADGQQEFFHGKIIKVRKDIKVL